MEGLGSLRSMIPRSTGLPQPVDTLDAARYYSTATRLNDGRVLIAGGYDRTSVATSGRVDLSAVTADG